MKLKKADITVTVIFAVILCVILIPGVFMCVNNAGVKQCEKNLYSLINFLTYRLNEESETGATFWHNLVDENNSKKLLSAMQTKIDGGEKMDVSAYFIDNDGQKLTFLCKDHKELTGITMRITEIGNNAKAKEKNPQPSPKPEEAVGKRAGERPLTITVNGGDTYFQGQSIDIKNPEQMQFNSDDDLGRIFNRLKVTARYADGSERILKSDEYTITTPGIDMTTLGKKILTVSYTSDEKWGGSIDMVFEFDVVESADREQFIVDGGEDGKYLLYSWTWENYVEDAQKSGEQCEFDGSIIYYKDSYYYYPDGFVIINKNDNTDMLSSAKDIDDTKKAAYCIKVDLNSVENNMDDKSKIHNGSLRVDGGDECVYIYQEKKSKEFDPGWIRIYSELKKLD